MLELINDRDWMLEANCLGADPDLFFPDRGQFATEAKNICSDCVVKAECLEYALVHREKWGVWGGTVETERRVLRSQRSRRNKPLLGKD